MFKILLCIMLITSYTVTSQEIEIIQPPQPVSACVGETVTFTCVVMFPSGSNPGGAVWFTDDLNVNAGAEPGHTTANDNDGRPAPTNVTNTLMITIVSTGNNGSDYVCQQGGGGTIRSTAVFLTVFAPPADPPLIGVTAPMSSESFTVNWTSLDPTYSYTVIWTNLNNNQIINQTAEENTNSDEVTGLTGVDNYNVSVAAVNMCGMMISDPVTVYGPPAMPMYAMVIENLTTSESFVVTWDDVNDPFDVTYVVMWTDGNTVTSNTATETSYTVTGLTTNTTYSVTVTAINTCCGAGPTTPPLQAVTNELPPTDPPTSTPTNPPGESDGGGSDNTGTIIGTVVGGICGAIVVVVVIVVVVYCCCCGKDGKSTYPVSMSSSIPPMYDAVQSPLSDKVPVDTNPAYALSTGGTIKMDDDPAYQTMTGGAGSGQSVKMTQNPAYALPM